MNLDIEKKLIPINESVLNIRTGYANKNRSIS
ncbi:hypothetical protein SAMN05421738_1121 [Algoriella xinjiangensis]|uniref:Uncharacterized protein n=1 Tax=Algoriella xinjiangensis TaxID=684065 RepID=A0A1I4YU78_9FLAO|nr:hypothetical protein SAMN05421738_1121 [Algoriella xinjiangensis]